jgi:hypothetical protein
MQESVGCGVQDAEEFPCRPGTVEGIRKNAMNLD